MVRGPVSAVDGSSVELLEGSNSDVLAKVDETGNGSYSTRPHQLVTHTSNSLPLTGTDVEPVLVVRSELLVGTSLDNVDPGGDLELT